MTKKTDLVKTEPYISGLPVLLSEERRQIITVPDRGTMAIVVKTLNIPADGFDLIIKPREASGNYPGKEGSRQPKSETYSLLSQLKGMSFRQLGNLQIERNKRGKIQSVCATMQAEYIGPNGEVIIDEETMFLDMDDFINEERKSRCFQYNPKTKIKELIEGRANVVRNEIGDVEDVIYTLPDAEEIEVHANCERRRTMLPRNLLTKLHNRLTRRATGIGARPVRPGGENAPERVCIIAAVTTHEARTGTELGIYQDEPTTPACEDSGNNVGVPPEDELPPQTEDAASQTEPVKCDTCGRDLTEKDLQYCPRKNTGRNDCYGCWQKSKEK